MSLFIKYLDIIIWKRILIVTTEPVDKRGKNMEANNLRSLYFCYLYISKEK